MVAPRMTRRDLVKCAVAGAGALGLSPLARLLQAAQSMPAGEPTDGAARRPPNIVLILADDLGWNGVSYNGNDFIETPSIDQLARGGIVFNAAYVCGANCAPSRACLLSGQYTPRHGVYAVGETDRGPRSLMRLVPIPNRTDLPPECVTVAAALRSAGYATGMFGKWHLGGPNGPASPRGQGFDVALETEAMDGPDDPKGIYTITRAACEFMEQNRNRPFFAYVAHRAIHAKQQARPQTLAKFKSKPPGSIHKDPLYAACTYDLDDGVGILLGKLDELGLTDNTLVVFGSDNGGVPRSSQEPLRGAKGCYYEGGIRVPTVMRWPGRIRPGTACDVPVGYMDLYPTFLGAADVAAPSGHTLDGESLLPVLQGTGELRRRAIFWHFPGYLNGPVPRGRDPVFRTRPVSVIRKGDWKLHLYHEEWVLDGGRDRIDTNNCVELYNVVEDIGERENLAGTNKAKRDELLDDLLAWISQTPAPLPSQANAGYDPTKPVEEPKVKADD